MWSVDLAGPFPQDENGMVYAMVAVDVFSKWVEIGLLPSKRAMRTCEWFYNEVICRWGKPTAIRLDNGAEWLGQFKTMMSNLGVTMTHSSVGNSRANGQAERTIRTLKDVVRRQMTAHPTSYWSDAIPYALLAMRMTTSRAHGLPPFTIITGSYPSLPSMLLEG